MENTFITGALVTFSSAFAGSALKNAEGPGQALDDIMTLIGFDRLHEVAEKKRAQREQNILEYKESIAQNIAQIPEDNLQEPPLSVVGPALEASKYYIEEESLRDMFAKLIGNSMDRSQNTNVHPSFVELIKQLNVIDAKILQYLKGNMVSHNFMFPVIKVERLLDDNQARQSVHPIIFLYDISEDFLKNSSSIDNLERLGILKVDFTKWFTDKKMYSIYSKHVGLTDVLNNNPDLKTENGIAQLTEYGKKFINAAVL